MLLSEVYTSKNNAFQAAVSREVACWLVTVLNTLVANGNT